jgi:hypothetical protein
MSRKIIGWAIIIYSITSFLVVLIYLMLHLSATPFWLPIAFFATFLPFNVGFYYVFGNRKKRRRKSID